jgi:type IV fimbrial biogenesis protein FimT
VGQFDVLLGLEEGRIVLKPRSLQGGFSLIELMIAFALIVLLLFLAVPNFTIFLRNTQIKNAGESVLQGLNLARTESVRRNAAIRFQFVSNLTAGCALATNSANWIVSVEDPTGKCQVDPSDTASPMIVQKRSGTEGTSNVVLSTVGGSTVTFNGLGQVSGAPVTQIDLSTTGGICEHVNATTGTMRCLRVLVSSGGQVKLCDPKVTSAADPRRCA